MNPVTRYELMQNSSHPCPEFATMAERQLSAFLSAITQRFGSEQAKLSAEDWLQELIKTDDLPASAREWRLLTAKASARFASRVSTSSLSTLVSTSLSTEPQIA